MPLEITKHAGFCMGVRRAVDMALETAKENGPCHSLGELIHNKGVVDWLREKEIVPINAVEEAEGGTLIIRSHGVSPDVLEACESRGLHVVDCTCPFVEKLHHIVADYTREGLPVVLAGAADHPEVVGTAGYAKGPVHIIATLEEAASLPSMEKALMVAQTTFPKDMWESLVKAVSSRVAMLTVHDTICSATARRQEEARELASRAHRMVVVGGKNSANTKKLYEACKARCEKTILVECAAELPPGFTDTMGELIGITAGASTPDWSLKEVVTHMIDREQQDQIQANVENAEDQVQAAQEEVQAAPEATGEAVAPEAPVQEAPAVEAAPEPEAAPTAAEEETQEPNAAAEEAAKSSFMADVEATMVKIRPGQTVTGTVVQITDDEVCVNIGYKSDGLIKRSDLTAEDVKMGDELEVEVVKVNDGEGNVILSQRNIVNRKAWDALMAKYEADEYVQGVGKEAVKGGLIADVDGVRAFVPASQLAQRYVEKISDFVGKPMELKIIEVDKQKKRVVASRKAVLIEQSASKKEEAWSKLAEGEVITGVVRRLTDFGAFVDVGGVDGLIHITDLSWGRVKHPSDVVAPGAEIEVKILSLDKERERIQLGYKQLQPKPWDLAEEKYPVGSIVEGKVVRITTFGAFVELEHGIDGLVHISQLSLQRVQKVEDAVSVGQIVRVKVLKVDPVEKRISLSIREVLEDEAFNYSDAIPGESEYELAASIGDDFTAEEGNAEFAPPVSDVNEKESAELVEEAPVAEEAGAIAEEAPDEAAEDAKEE